MRTQPRMSGAPYLRKFGYLSIQEILVITSPYTRPPIRTTEKPM